MCMCVCVCVCVCVCCTYTQSVGEVKASAVCIMYIQYTGGAPRGAGRQGGGPGSARGGGGLESAVTRVHGVRTVDSNVQQEVGEQD